MCVLGGVFGVVMAAAAGADTYYVAPDGKQENDGSKEKP